LLDIVRGGEGRGGEERYHAIGLDIGYGHYIMLQLLLAGIMARLVGSIWLFPASAIFCREGRQARGGGVL